MSTFVKAQFASLTATVVDFLVTIVLVEVFHCWYVIGSATGTIAGGITHFSLSRVWVFEAGHKKIHSQAIKYIMVWIVYLLLSTGGVFIITHYTRAGYILSKICVSIVMSISYNYVLHKKFVFK